MHEKTATNQHNPYRPKIVRFALVSADLQFHVLEHYSIHRQQSRLVMNNQRHRLGAASLNVCE